MSDNAAGMGSRTALTRVLLCLAFAAVLSGCSLQPSAPADQLSATQIFEASKPAVVLVEAAQAVSWSVPEPRIDPSKQGMLQDQLAAMVRAGTIGSSEDALKRAAVQLITNDPGAWFSLGGSR